MLLELSAYLKYCKYSNKTQWIAIKDIPFVLWDYDSEPGHFSLTQVKQIWYSYTYVKTQ